MSQTECQNRRCARPTDLYLCTDCTDELSTMFTALVTGATWTETLTIRQGRTASGRPWRIEYDRQRRSPGLLEILADAATGQVRFGQTSRRHTNPGLTLHGDMTIAQAAGLDEALDPERLRNRLLAAGHVNGRASKLIAEIRTELTTATNQLTQIIGIALVPLDPYDIASYALWLADHTHDLAKTETAGKLFTRITHLSRQAEKCVDRPPTPRFCGQCDTMIDRKMCGLALYAPRDAIEVTCPNRDCRTVHNIEKLFTRTLNSAEYKLFPRDVLIGNQRTDTPERYTTGIMGELGEFVHWQAFNRWVRDKRLKPRMFLRPNGRRGFYRQSDEDIPEYRLADLRNLKRTMDTKTGKAKAG